MNYWEAELSDIKTAGSEDAVKLKLRTSCSETKWLTLRPSEFEAVEALLVELYAAREDAGVSSEQRTEFQRKWDYVESHNLMTVTPAPGFTVTLQDRTTAETWSGNSLQEAISAHQNRPAVDYEAKAVEAEAALKASESEDAAAKEAAWASLQRLNDELYALNPKEPETSWDSLPADWRAAAMTAPYVTPGHPVMAGAGYDCSCGECLYRRSLQAQQLCSLCEAPAQPTEGDQLPICDYHNPAGEPVKLQLPNTTEQD